MNNRQIVNLLGVASLVLSVVQFIFGEKLREDEIRKGIEEGLKQANNSEK